MDFVTSHVGTGKVKTLVIRLASHSFELRKISGQTPERNYRA